MSPIPSSEVMSGAAEKIEGRAAALAQQPASPKTSQSDRVPDEAIITHHQRDFKPEYITGVKLVLVVASVALSCFLMLVDTMVISTVSGIVVRTQTIRAYFSLFCQGYSSYHQSVSLPCRCWVVRQRIPVWHVSCFTIVLHRECENNVSVQRGTAAINWQDIYALQNQGSYLLRLCIACTNKTRIIVDLPLFLWGFRARITAMRIGEFILDANNWTCHRRPRRCWNNQRCHNNCVKLCSSGKTTW